MKKQTKNTTLKHLSNGLKKQLSKRRHQTYYFLAGVAIALALSPAHIQTAWYLDYQNYQTLLSEAARQVATHKLFVASETNNLTLTLEAINEQAYIDAINKYEQTALGDAALRGHSDIVRLLLEHNAGIDLQNEDGDTALIAAARKGHSDSVHLLLQHHADMNIQNRYDRSALIVAARRGHSDSVRLLLQHHADINIRDICGYTALMWASQNGHTNSLCLLLEHDAVTNIQNKYAYVALMRAAKNNQPDTVRTLILYGTTRKDIHLKIKNIPVEMQATIENAMKKRFVLEAVLGHQNWDMETASPLSIIQEFIAPPVLVSIIADYANPYDPMDEAFLQGAIKCYIKNNITVAALQTKKRATCAVQ